MKRSLKLLAAAVAFASLSTAATAQDQYPSQNIKFVVPFTAGSATDTLARLLANRMSTTLGRTVVVENVAGGNGIPASQNVARATPDGYTVMVTANTTHAGNQALLKKVPYDAVADFEPITKLGSITLALVAHPSVPANNLKELIAYGKANPGKLKGFGVSGLKRSALAPNLPTLDESGLKGYELTAWFAAYAPAKTPKPIVDKLNAAFREALADKSVADKLLTVGIEPEASTPEELKAFQAAETVKWKKIAADAKIEPQ